MRRTAARLLRPIACLWLLALPLAAQELDCTVEIDAGQVQTQERQIFDQMQADIEKFMNTTRWTNDDFEDFERIKCNFLITLRGSSTIQIFDATVQIRSQRPIYGTDMETPVLQFFDQNWRFEYQVSQPLVFAENVYTTELTSLLAYYAYLVIALDYDSFAPMGGSPYYDRALNILNNSSQAGGPGWSSFGDTRDRYWLCTNLVNPQFQPFRQAIYEYHRLGLDVFAQDRAAGRAAILSALKKVDQTAEQEPQAVTLNAFFDAKGDELINVFSRGDDKVREEASELLQDLDPSNSGDYRRMVR